MSEHVDRTHATVHDAHAHGHAEAEPDNTNVAMLGFLVAITTAVLVVTVWGLDIYFKRETEDLKQSRLWSVENPDKTQLRAREQEWLTGFGVVDAEREVYRVPIDRAMNLLVREVKARQEAAEPQRIGPPPAPAPAPGTAPAAPGTAPAPTPGAPTAPAPGGTTQP